MLGIAFYEVLIEMQVQLFGDMLLYLLFCFDLPMTYIFIFM